MRVGASISTNISLGTAEESNILVSRAEGVTSHAPLPAPLLAPTAARRRLFAMVGICISLFASNLYYAQPILLTIAHDLKLPTAWAGSTASAAQLGYGLGMLTLVPMADAFENKRLVLTCWLCTLCSLVGIALAQSAAAFFIFMVLMGFFSSGTQILIPYLSHIIPEAMRGRIIGMIMAGTLLSVMLARPFALFVAVTFGWRAIYLIAATATFVAGLGLWNMMPRRRPLPAIRYSETMRSMRGLFANEAGVQRRTIYQALLFASFTMFWTVIPIVLADRFGLSKSAIAIFALAGAGGVFAAPLAGRLSDNGSSRSGTALASVLAIIAFASSIWSVEMGLLTTLVIAAFVIDAAIQMAQVLSRMVVLEVSANVRGRVNAMYMTIVYVSGAAGSIIGILLYFSIGWTGVAVLGCGAASCVLIGIMSERKATLLPTTKRVS